MTCNERAQPHPCSEASVLIFALVTQLLLSPVHLEVTSKGPKWELQHLALRALKFYETEAQMALQLPGFFPLTPSGLQFLGGGHWRGS